MANFCTNCGFKLGKDDNFCTNCGTRTNKFDIKQDKSVIDNIEKKQAKKEFKRVVGGRVLFNKDFVNTLSDNDLTIDDGWAIREQVEKEIESGQIKSGGVEFRVNQLIVEYKIKKENELEDHHNKIKMIDEIFESEEIKSEIMENKIDRKFADSIKAALRDKLINKREDMGEDEIKYFIKTELKKESKAQEKRRREEQERVRKLKEQERIRKEMIANGDAGYCGFGCRYFREEFLDKNGGVVGDFDFEGAGVDYYCRLGHSAYPGNFCRYYEN